MKVKASHWVNYNGTWYKHGDVFEVKPEHEARVPYMGELVDAEPVRTEKHEAEITVEPVKEPAETVKRTRRRKTNE